MVTVTVVMADPAQPSPVAARALHHVQAAAGRLAGQVSVEVLALDDPRALEFGLGLEPAVLVGSLLIAAGQAPPAGHVLRAIEAALAREGKS